MARERIAQIFVHSEDTLEAALELYKVAFPDWDSIESISGWPKVSERTNKYLFRKFIALDEENLVNHIRGGLWLNKGFGTDYDLPDWVIDFEGVKVEYQMGV